MFYLFIYPLYLNSVKSMQCTNPLRVNQALLDRRPDIYNSELENISISGTREDCDICAPEDMAIILGNPYTVCCKRKLTLCFVNFGGIVNAKKALSMFLLILKDLSKF